MKYLIIAIFLVLIGAIAPVTCTVKEIQFNQQCEGYLKQTADANTAEIALERINLAIEYIEAHNLTDGYTSVLWRTECDNIGYWYKNIKACKSELEKSLGGTQLEKSNVLMKVRESLTDNGESGTVLTTPYGISRYPYNTLWGIGLWVSWIAFAVGILFFMIFYAERY